MAFKCMSRCSVCQREAKGNTLPECQVKLSPAFMAHCGPERLRKRGVMAVTTAMSMV